MVLNKMMMILRKEHMSIPAAFFFFALNVLTSPAVAQGSKQPVIDVNVDRQPLVQGEPFVLTIHIETNSRKDPEINLPRFSGLRVLQRSESHPMSFSFSFGFGSGSSSQTKNESNYNFVLVADRPGQYRINPVEVILDGRSYKGNPYVLNIVQAGTQTSLPTAQSGQSDDVLQDSANANGEVQSLPQDLPGAKVDKNYFVQAHLSTTEAVVGQPIVLTIYLYAASNMSGIEVIREPGTEGFWVENLLDNNQRYVDEPVLVGGRQYDRGVLRKVVLFPIKTGKLTIAPTVVDIQIRRGGFFSESKSVKRMSLPVQVDVSALPKEAQPNGFDPANVGNYTFTASVDNSSIRVGEPVTLILKVTGEGNIRNLNLPSLTQLPSFKVYDPETDSEVKIQGETVTGVKTGRILMIAQEAGNYTVPEISWSFYNPESKTYRELRSLAQNISVQAGSSAAQQTENPIETTAPNVVTGQDRLNRQLKSIIPKADLETEAKAPMLTRMWFLAIAIVVPLFYLGVLVISRAKRMALQSSGKTRFKKAHSVAATGLKELSNSAGSISSEEFFGKMSRILIKFFEDRLEAPIVGDTIVELKQRLLERGFSKDLAEKIIVEMESCDFARFARGAGVAEEQRGALKRMESLINELALVTVTPEKEVKS